MAYWSQDTDQAPQLQLQKMEKHNTAILARGSRKQRFRAGKAPENLKGKSWQKVNLRKREAQI